MEFLEALDLSYSLGPRLFLGRSQTYQPGFFNLYKSSAGMIFVTKPLAVSV